MKRLLLLFFFSLLALTFLLAQELEKGSANRVVVRQLYVVTLSNDTIPMFRLRPINVFPVRKFKNKKERIAYTKLVRDVRKTYPYAKMISSSIIETYEYMQTMADERARQKHLEKVQKYMMQRYKPEMKKMTKTQGRILIKLIDRECNITSYEIVKSLLGEFKAGLYNTFAGLFGNSLKTKYDPMGRDYNIEEIVLQLQDGSLDYYYSASTYVGK